MSPCLCIIMIPSNGIFLMSGGYGMGWVALFVIIALVATFADSIFGKIVMSATVLAIGLLLLKWITGITIFVVLAKVCAVIIVVAIVVSILISIIE